MTERSAGAGTSSRAWRPTLYAVCVSQAAAIVGFDFTLPFIPFYLQRDLGVHGLGATALWAGLIGFGPAIPSTIFAPLWGAVADRWGYRPMLLRAMISAAVLLTAMAFVPSPGVLLALRMLQGALTGTVFASQALVAATVPERELGRSMSLLQMSISVGATAGPVAGGAVASMFGYRLPFLCAGAAIGLAALLVVLFVREPARRPGPSAGDVPEPSVRSVLRVRAFAAAVGLTLVTQLAATALFPVIPLFVQELLRGAGTVAADTGWLMALYGVTSAAGAYVAGRLQRRYGVRPMLLASLALMGLLVLPMTFTASFLQFLALRTMAGFAGGALSSMVGIWAAISSPANARGRAFGLIGAASSLGFGAGPLLGGLMAASVGIRPIFALSSMLFAGVPIVVTAISIWLLAARRLHLAEAPVR